MKKHSISIKGHRTSYSLEKPFYEELVQLAKNQNIPLARMIANIDSERETGTNLSSALRLFVLKQLKNELGK